LVLEESHLLLSELEAGCIADEETGVEVAIDSPFGAEDEPFVEGLFVAGTFSDDIGVSDGDVFPLV